jgi:hypothetical protein
MGAYFAARAMLKNHTMNREKKKRAGQALLAFAALCAGPLAS